MTDWQRAGTDAGVLRWGATATPAAVGKADSTMRRPGFLVRVWPRQASESVVVS